MLSLRRLLPLAPAALAGFAALSLSACGAGPRKASTSTVDAIILDRGPVVGGDGDRSSGVRALVAAPSKTLPQLLSAMRTPLFGDGGKTKLLPYLNGLVPKAPPPGAEAAKHSYPGLIAYPGDRVGWTVQNVSDIAPVPPAVVGLFPAPFSTRFTAKRRLLPARIQCADVKSAACITTGKAFEKLQLPAATSNLQDTSGVDEVRIYVGSWPALRPILARGRLSAALKIEGQAETNGYGIQISADGKSIRAGAKFGEAAPTTTYGAGAGIIFAMQDSIGVPLWVVTGADDAGAAKAAAALSDEDLDGRIAAIVPAN